MTPVMAVLTRSTNVATSIDAIERFTVRSLAGALDRRRESQADSRRVLRSDAPRGRSILPLPVARRAHTAPATGFVPRRPTSAGRPEYHRVIEHRPELPVLQRERGGAGCACLLYTSDAADEEDSVDLGGRRI